MNNFFSNPMGLKFSFWACPRRALVAIFSISLLIFVAAGCATTVPPSKLEVVKSPQKVVVAAPFEITVDRSSIACKYIYKYVLDKGEYTSHFQDADGLYFFGNKLNVKEEQVVASCGGGVLHKIIANGGFFLPNDKSKPAKLFYILKSRVGAPLTREQIETHEYRMRSDRTYSLFSNIAEILNDMEKESLWFPPQQPSEPSLRRILGN